MYRTFVKGDFIDGSAIVIRKEDGFFVYELEFEDGSVLRLPYSFVDRFYSGYAVVDSGRGMGIINRKGEEVLPTVFNVVTSFLEERAFLGSDEHTILIDSKLNYLAFFEPYLVTHDFKNGTALLSRIVDNGEKTEEALIDRDGNFIAEFANARIIQSIADIVTEDPLPGFHEGIEYYMADGCRGVRDREGNELVEDEPFF